jgi:hypothetical protein
LWQHQLEHQFVITLHALKFEDEEHLALIVQIDVLVDICGEKQQYLLSYRLQVRES